MPRYELQQWAQDTAGQKALPSSADSAGPSWARKIIFLFHSSQRISTQEFVELLLKLVWITSFPWQGVPLLQHTVPERTTAVCLYTRQQIEYVFIHFVPQQSWCLNMLFVFQGAASTLQTQTASSTQRLLLLIVYFLYPWLHSDPASEGRRTKLHPSHCPQWLLNKPQTGKMWVQIWASWVAVMTQGPQFLDNSQHIHWKAWDISYCFPQKKLIKVVSFAVNMRIWRPTLFATGLNEGISPSAIIKITTTVTDYLYINIALQPQQRTQWDKNLQEQNKRSKNNFKVCN